MKKLSIITIAYNNREGLKLTIDSVINQSAFDKIEYIVIDGGSSDGSRELLESYSKKLTHWVSEPDSGIYNAMNKGAWMSSGEYLLFLNSGDNLRNSNVIENILDKLSGQDIVCGQVVTHLGNIARLKIPPKNISLFTFVGGSLPHPSSFIKRTIFDKVGGYDESYRIISDWCFFILATIKENCTYKTIPIVVSDFYCDGISSTSCILEESKTIEFLQHHFGRIMLDYLSPEDEAISNCCFWVSKQHGICGKVLRFPFRVINSIFKLRNRISRKIGGYPI